MLGRTLSGRVLRDNGHPVPDAALTLIDAGGHQVSRTTGDPDGHFFIDPPTSGRYVLIVAANGLQPEAVHVTVTDGGAQHLDLALRASGELSGVVRTAIQEPVPDTTITVTDLHGEVVGAAVTTTDGTYACHGVVAGTYTLVAVADRMRPTAVTLTVPDSGLLRFDVELAPMASLSGTVRADGRTIYGVQVTVLDSSGTPMKTARTDEDGRYSVTNLPDGEYTLIARSYPPVTSRVTVSGNEIGHDLQLSFDADEHAESAIRDRARH
ncbi:carboxypeptidase-like regulatory domain-containing protein [Nocardia sp. AG03]|uniref:MSCRAMM family protein n=1 Tax=Nocardia sp. AG03 TaxID=3025312 RepID=UPI00241827BC|nr:carboxypeptidase-like regulatory domain-containing protein [Nocardia sp. AG03]